MIWKNLMKQTLLHKENFYSHLSMEDSTHADYPKRVCKNV